MSLFRRAAATLPVDDTFGNPDAAHLRTALSHRDWSTARSVLGSATDADHLSMLTDATASVPHSETWLPEVLRAEPGNPLPLLVYGARMVEWVWEARTYQWADQVGGDRLAVFNDRLRIAEQCLYAVIDLQPDNVVAWHKLITVSRGLGHGLAETHQRFEQVVRRHPYHLRAHDQMMQILCAKWRGSHEQMHHFAREAMLKTPAGNPLGHLVASAHLEMYLVADSERARRRYMRSHPVRAALREAADASVRHPLYRPGPDWAIAHSAFAMAFALADEYALAAEQFRILGDVVLRFPWTYADGDDPGRAFCRLRATSYARRR